MKIAATETAADQSIIYFEIKKVDKFQREICQLILVTRRGFEPRTPCLKGRCSAN